MKALPFASLALFLVPLSAWPQPSPAPAALRSTYVLGPDDQLAVRVLDAEEIGDKPVRIDMSGFLRLPLAGRIHASGLTVEQLETAIAARLKEFVKQPDVSVSVTEFRAQPVSVLGAVRTPGVHQVRGTKTLYEVLSLAGGLNPDAGSSIKITRRKSAGLIPLPTAHDDSTGEFQVATVDVKSVMEAQNPSENIAVLPDDVVSVPKADLVYVIGAVRKSGGFVLSEKEKMSVLQALSLAEGLDRGAAPKDARILRPVPESENRQEISVNLKQILDGKSGDVSLLANDILFVPASGAKNAFTRGVEAAIQIGTGVAIYHR